MHMGIFFRDDNDNDNDDDEYRGPTGDPLHDAVYGWDVESCSSEDYDYGTETDFEDYGTIIDTGKRDEYSEKAWDLYMKFKEAEALRYINMALNLDESNPNNWNIKAIILQAMKRYSESEKCYDRSLELSFDNLVCDNKVRMLYDWASDLIQESKKVPNGLEKLEKAKEINIRAITSRPGENSEEDLDKYLHQRDSINYCINYEREYLKNLETLKSFDKEELFTIAGMIHYKKSIDLAPGVPLKLAREPDNEHDRDAIAVYYNDEKVGYVANSPSTKHESTSSASELKDKIQDTCEAYLLFHLERYADIHFSIGRIIR